MESIRKENYNRRAMLCRCHAQDGADVQQSIQMQVHQIFQVGKRQLTSSRRRRGDNTSLARPSMIFFWFRYCWPFWQTSNHEPHHSKSTVVLQNVEQGDGPKFVVKNTIVEDSIFIHQDNNMARGANEGHFGVYPHKDLKYPRPKEDTKKFLTHMHKGPHNWGLLLMHFTKCTNAGVPGVSSRTLTLCHLKITRRGFVPMRKGPRSCTLMLILQKGNLQKDNHTTYK